MKTFEKIVGVIAAVAIILKLLRVEGSGLLTVLSLMTLTVFYYLGFALFNDIRLRNVFKSASYKYTNPKRIIGAFALGFSFSSIVIGMLFKMQLWTGGQTQLISGLIVMVIIFVIALVMFLKSRDVFYIPIFKRIAIFGGMGLFLLLTPDPALIDIYYHDNPDYAELMKQVMANPENHELQTELQIMREEMNKE